MKTALLFGSSGLVGGHLLNQLIKDINYSKIKLFVRSVPEISDPKVEIIKIDFSNLQNNKAVFITLMNLPIYISIYEKLVFDLKQQQQQSHPLL